MVEHRPVKAIVAGSSPASGAISILISVNSEDFIYRFFDDECSLPSSMVGAFLPVTQ
jgi:hypothetical protein